MITSRNYRYINRKLSHNYKPINLLSHTSKSMKKIIIRRMKEEEKLLWIMTNKWCGFTERLHQSKVQLTRMIEDNVHNIFTEYSRMN